MVAFGGRSRAVPRKPQRAILTAVIGSTNQIYGFVYVATHSYDRVAVWAMAMGLGTLLVTLLSVKRISVESI